MIAQQSTILNDHKLSSMPNDYRALQGAIPSCFRFVSYEWSLIRP
ncbi:hypothetical protein PHET_07331 [Paragonimus heterotremus]|uniref:Uncharacterized protein n=1 Tax=Paragonimus heterotremus TaxID=100268 RepID=A0A8J4SMH2_9TREM|nr:hypothetical protein PHET_07331 [Paragonimus heterotremus]